MCAAAKNSLMAVKCFHTACIGANSSSPTRIKMNQAFQLMALLQTAELLSLDWTAWGVGEGGGGIHHRACKLHRGLRHWVRGLGGSAALRVCRLSVLLWTGGGSHDGSLRMTKM